MYGCPHRVCNQRWQQNGCQQNLHHDVRLTAYMRRHSHSIPLQSLHWMNSIVSGCVRGGVGVSVCACSCPLCTGWSWRCAQRLSLENVSEPSSHPRPCVPLFPFLNPGRGTRSLMAASLCMCERHYSTSCCCLQPSTESPSGYSIRALRTLLQCLRRAPKRFLPPR